MNKKQTPTDTAKASPPRADPGAQEAWLAAVKTHLDTDCESLPESLRERLYASRQQALRKLDEAPPPRLIRAWWLAPVLAASILFALILPWWHSPGQPGEDLSALPGAMETTPELAELPASAQLDVLENMEFYLWLEQQPKAMTNLEKS
jgi:hypothetical protein